MGNLCDSVTSIPNDNGNDGPELAQLNFYIAVCLWHFEGDPGKAAIRLKLTKDHGVFTTLPQILKHISLRMQDAVAETTQPLFR